MALMGRAFSQAQKFGVEVAIPDEAVTLECGDAPCRVQLKTGERIQARSVVIATGARYRRLEVDELEAFEGSSVHYWASPLEGDLCAGQDVALVGGGNSAGQATVFLASRARRVTLIARRPLDQTMSQYLVERIEALPNVDVVTGCEIASLEGKDGALEAVGWRDRASGAEDAAAGQLSLLLHRRRAQHRLARGLGTEARPARLRAHRRGHWRRSPAARNQPPRRLRGRRRALEFGQTGCSRRRRWGAGYRRDP